MCYDDYNCKTERQVIYMKKARFDLSEREQKVMELFWSMPEGLTSVDLIEQLSDIMINATYAHRSLNTLLEKGFIEECGSVRYNKQYARKFRAAITREEYAAGLLEEKGIHFRSLNGIAMAFLKQSENVDRQEKEAVVQELKQLIAELEGEDE